MIESSANHQTNPEYLECKNRLENIYEEKANGIRIRSKCSWYEQGEKSSNFFLNLEKSRSVQGLIRRIFTNNKEVTGSNKINKELYNFYNNLFTEKNVVSYAATSDYLKNVSIPQLNDEQIRECDDIINENELFQCLKLMPNNKSPGNHGLTKEFYESFWEEIKNPLLLSFDTGFDKKN